MAKKLEFRGQDSSWMIQNYFLGCLPQPCFCCNRTQCIDSSFTVQHFCRLARNPQIVEIDDCFVKSFN